MCDQWSRSCRNKCARSSIYDNWNLMAIRALFGWNYFRSAFHNRHFTPDQMTIWIQQQPNHLVIRLIHPSHTAFTPFTIFLGIDSQEKLNISHDFNILIRQVFASELFARSTNYSRVSCPRPSLIHLVTRNWENKQIQIDFKFRDLRLIQGSRGEEEGEAHLDSI